MRGLLARCFEHQGARGGLPETFPGTRPGCWTSSEVYAAITSLDLVDLCPPDALELLEEYLVEVCERHGGRGLPYYEVLDADGQARSTCMVEASASLCIGLHQRRPGSPLVPSIARWLAESQNATGGWGIASGEPDRTYSTAYAVMALEPLGWSPSEVERGREWLTEAARTGEAGTWWSYRPGLEVPSALMTALAVSALGITPGDRRAPGIVRFLLGQVERGRLVEEDEFPTSRGLKLSFLYAPRLASLAALFALQDRGAGGADSRVDLDRCLRALAHYEFRTRQTGRPAVDLADERLWHYIELGWGYGGVRVGLERLGTTVQRRYEEHAAVVSRDLTRRRLLRRAPPPLAAALARCWEQAELPGERLLELISATEATCRLARARQASFCSCSDRPRSILPALEKPHPGAGTTLRQLWTSLKKARLADPRQRASAASLVEQDRALRSLLSRWLGLRNRHAHGGPATAAGRMRAAESWDSLVAEVLCRFDALLEPPFVTLERVGLPGHASGYSYRLRSWRGNEASWESLLLTHDRRVPDHVVVQVQSPDGGRSERTVGCVYTGDLAHGGVDGLLPMSPFVVRLMCDDCGERHFFLLVGGLRRDSGQGELDPSTRPLVVHAPRCGAELMLLWPEQALGLG